MSGIELSIVIPVFNEAENLVELISELAFALEAIGKGFEVIIVNDGSTDETHKVVMELQAELPFLCYQAHSKKQGKTAAWFTGFKLAKADVICTMDGDLQNDPRDINTLIEKLSDEYDLVSGYRSSRDIALFSRNIPSKAANGIMRLFGSRLRDHGCGFKVFKKKIISNMPQTRGIHRLFGLFAEIVGNKVAEESVNDRVRKHGKSKYGLSRILKLPFDLLRLECHLFAQQGHQGGSMIRLYLSPILLIITFIGFLLRAYQLGTESFWYDEILTVLYSNGPIMGIPAQLSAMSVHPPLYFFLSNIMVTLFGTSEISLRALSVLFGTLSIPVIFHFGLKVINLRVAYIAAFLLALSPFHIIYSQEARAYALMSFLILVSVLSYHQLLLRNAQKDRTIYIISSTLLAYTHVFGLMTLICQNIHYLCLRKNFKDNSISVKKWYRLQIIVGLLFLPWAASFIYQVLFIDYSWIPSPTLNTAKDFLIRVHGYSDQLRNISIALMFLGIVGAVAKKKQSVINSGIYSTIFWMFGPIILTVIVSLLYKPIFVDRYLMQTVLFYLVVVAVGGSIICNVHKYAWLPLFATLIYLLWGSNYNYYNDVTKAHWQHTVNLIKSNINENDIILTYPGDISLSLDYYLDGEILRYNIPRDAVHIGKNKREQEIKLQKKMGFLSGKKRVWLIYRHPRPFPTPEERAKAVELSELLLPDYRREEFELYQQISVGLFVRD